MLELNYSKRTYLGRDAKGRKRWLVRSSLAPLQFREGGGEWQDIDTVIVDGKVTKSWYELNINPDKLSLTVKDKRTDGIATLTIKGIPASKIKKASPVTKGNTITWENIDTDLDLKIVVQRQRVTFQRILKSDKASEKADFEIIKSGDIQIQSLARDAEGNPLELTASEKDGVLTESLVSKVGLKYPVTIDPSISVGASTDDLGIYWNGSAWVAQSLSRTSFQAGWAAASALKYGAGMRFQNVTIPQGATIDTAYLAFKSPLGKSGTVVRTRITGNDADDAATWSTLADYQARRGTIVGGANNDYITDAQVDWDGIGAWSYGGGPYNSLSIVSVIQEIVNRVGWASGHALALWWDDHDGRSSAVSNCYRVAVSSDDTDWDDPPELTFTYTAGGGAIPQSVGGGAITPTGTLGRKVSLGTGAGSVTPAGVLGRLTKMSIGAGAVTPTGVLSATQKFFPTVGEGAITPVGVLGRVIKLSTGAGAITPVGTLGRKILIAVGKGAITAVGVLVPSLVGVEILRPNATGDVTTLTKSGGTYNWEMVDEESPDDDTTYVGWYVFETSVDKYDLYNLPAHSGAGAISSIKVYVRCKAPDGDGGPSPKCYELIKTHGEEYENEEAITPDGYATFSHTWEANPYTSAAWTWDEIDDLQIGVRLTRNSDKCSTTNIRCTQVYVEVNYNPGLFQQIVGQGVITPVGILARKVSLVVGSGAITPAGVLNFLTKIVVGAGSITPVGVLGRIVKRFTGQGAVTPVGTLARKIYKTIGEGNITPSGVLGRLTKITAGSGTITPVGFLDTFLSSAQSVGQGVITPVGTLGRNIALAVGAGAITPIGTLGRKIYKLVGTGAITPTGALVQKMLLSVGGGTITAIGTLGRKIRLVVGGGSVTPTGVLSIYRKIMMYLTSLITRELTITSSITSELEITSDIQGG